MAALIQLHLKELGAQVQWESDGLNGLEAARRRGPWDLLVLDLQLPGLGGLELCRQLRAEGMRVPLLMLTARAAELDRVLGLELGADDYLAKPFSVLEFQARVKALWRRAEFQRVTPTHQEPESLECGLLRMDRQQRQAWLRGQTLALTAREFDLLWCFARAPGRAYSRAQLLELVWGSGYDGYEHTVNTHINRLRNKVGEHCIRTLWGVGYRFEIPA